VDGGTLRQGALSGQRPHAERYHARSRLLARRPRVVRPAPQGRRPAGLSRRRDAGDPRRLRPGVLPQSRHSAARGRVECEVTPIDAALPFVVAIVALWAWLIRRSKWMTAVLTAIPALVIGEVAVPDERLRLLLIGMMTAAAFGATVFITASGERGAGNSDQPSATSDQRTANSEQRPAISDQRTYVILGLTATFL